MSVSVETRTLLFSDIEGSTRLLAALGDAYPGVLADHRALVRKAIAAHSGTEHSTGGDGFFVIFASARDALAAAIDAQLALTAHPWPEGASVRVRMGVHAGEIGWDDDDVVGMAIHEAARIADAAHGGQVLVSPVARELVAGSTPAGVSLRSLGRHRLKDITDPLELFQAWHPELQNEFPALRTVDVVVDVPHPRTSFVGREHEVDEILRLLSAGRHVTLTGVGGSGKTRLALEVAVRDAARHADGVFFVDLAPLADPDLVLGSVASGVNVQGDPSDFEAMVLAYLSQRRALIVVDNCEHLIEACADAVDLILSRCPSITILATSREALQIDGEQSFRVPSLGVEDEHSEAVQLFVSRARAVSADFDLSDANREEVIAVCRRLDGIPLAIELAAARVDHLSVSDIAHRLDERFDLLVGGRRRRVQRQQTLQAAMDWSWALLCDEERTVLRRLAVFSGSFTLDAAEAVSDMRPAVDVLASLIAKSLVNLEPAEDVTRYRLLDNVRLYAQDRLVESGEAAERRDAHRDFYLALFESVSFDGYLDLRIISRCIVDYGNHRAALDWSMAQERMDLVARLTVIAAWTWVHVPALHDECRRWLLLISEDEAQPAPVRADALAALAVLSMTEGELSAIRMFAERSLAVSSDGDAYSSALWALGRYAEAAAVAAAAGYTTEARWSRAWEASEWLGHDPRRALEAFQAILAASDASWHGWDRWWALVGSTFARLAIDDGDGALADARSCRHLLEGFDTWGGSLFQYSSVLEAMALGHLGHFDEARATLRVLASAALRDRYPLVGNDCLVALAYIAHREGDHVQAATLVELVVADARLRCQPLYFFLGRFLVELHDTVEGDDLNPPLPSLRLFVSRVRSIGSGAEFPDETAVARIEAALVDFVGGSTVTRHL